MKNLRKFKDLRVYFVGIGGISMSGLARLLKNSGAIVSGSDIGVYNSEIKKLEGLGILVNHNHDAQNITKDANLVVYNYAIPKDNPELKRAKELGIKCVSRAELLGVIARKYKNVIAISGTHGKTTTTALLGEILCRAGLNPTIHIGGESVNLDDNTIIGDKDYLIVEACEYYSAFRYLAPNICVVLNIDADHLDYYKDLGEIYGAFGALIKKSKCLVRGKEVGLTHHDMVTIGEDIEARNIVYSDFGYNYDVYLKGAFWGAIRLNVVGKHNITNSLFAVSVALKCGIKKEDIIDGIGGFRGVKRRQEKIGEICGVPVIIDYAHHPTEIASSLQGFGECFSSPIVVFQPHTFSRTKALFDDFVKVLNKAQKLILYKTYPARESEIYSGRAEDLSKAIVGSSYEDNLDVLWGKLTNEAKKGVFDAIVVLGAGDLAEKLKSYF